MHEHYDLWHNNHPFTDSDLTICDIFTLVLGHAIAYDLTSDSSCSLSLFAGLTVRPCPCLRPSVSQCPEKNVRPPHMRAFNKAVAVVFNSSGDDNCGLRDGLLVKATAVRADFRAVIAAR